MRPGTNALESPREPICRILFICLPLLDRKTDQHSKHPGVRNQYFRLPMAEGKIGPHRFLLRCLVDQIQFAEHEIALLDERLQDLGRQRPDLSQAVARWDTIPRIDRLAAWAFLVEMGDTMRSFQPLSIWPVGPRSVRAITKVLVS